MGVVFGGISSILLVLKLRHFLTGWYEQGFRRLGGSSQFVSILFFEFQLDSRRCLRNKWDKYAVLHSVTYPQSPTYKISTTKRAQR